MMKISKFVAAAVLGVAVVGVSGVLPEAVAVAQEKKEAKVSKAAAKPLKAAKDAIDAKKYEEGIAKLKEVEAISDKNAYDTHLMHELYAFAYLRTKNWTEAAKHYEPGLTSGFLSEQEIPTRVTALAQINYQAKNYAKAIEYGERAFKGGYGDEDMFTLVSQAYYIKGDYKGTIKFADDYVDKQIKKGQKPKEQALQLIMSSCVKLEDDECTQRSLERMVAYYPKPEYWQNLMHSLFRAGGNDRSMLHIYRLASEVEALRGPEDYTEMAQLAIEQGSPGEAQRILEKGFANNVFVEERAKASNTRLLESAKKQAAADKAALAKLEKDAAAAKTGDADMALGLAYLSYEQPEKAAEALNRALTKGGLKNEAEARLLLGIAQLRAGKKDEATKAFESVKGNPTYERLANLWNLHAKQA